MGFSSQVHPQASQWWKQELKQQYLTQQNDLLGKNIIRHASNAQTQFDMLFVKITCTAFIVFSTKPIWKIQSFEGCTKYASMCSK